jgi:phosphatidate phosphatase APP1
VKRKLVAAALTAVAAVGMVVGVSTPAQASGKWCNNQVCIESYDSGTYIGRLEVSIWTQNQAGRVNARVWSDNGWSAWTHTEDVGAFTTYRGWVYPQRHFPSQTRICVEGFKSGGSYGLPCFTVV